MLIVFGPSWNPLMLGYFLQTQQTVALAHRLATPATKADRLEVKMFIQQLEHQAIACDGADFFGINRSLCYSVSWEKMVGTFEQPNLIGFFFGIIAADFHCASNVSAGFVAV